MSTRTDRETLVGVFQDRARAEQAVEMLERAGFTDDQIGFITHRENENVSTGTGVETESDAADTGKRAVAGGAAGGVLGGILGAAAALLIPGVGPVIAGGVLGATLGGVVIGAGAGGLIGALTKAGVPEEEAGYYNNEFQSGRTLVTVKTPDQDARQRAWDILQSNGAYDASSRDATATAGTSSATSYNTNAGMAGAGNADVTNVNAEQRIPLREEQLQVNKETVERGNVRLGKEVVEEERNVNVPVSHEEVYVERRPGSGQVVNDELNESSEQFRVPVREEQVNVNKVPVEREEIRLGKRNVQENQQVRETVRREEPRIEREGDVNDNLNENL